jgi:hypothetical protein
VHLRLVTEVGTVNSLDDTVALVLEVSTSFGTVIPTYALCRGTLGLEDAVDIVGPTGQIVRGTVATMFPRSKKGKIMDAAKKGERFSAAEEIGDMPGAIKGITAQQIAPGSTIRLAGATWPIQLVEGGTRTRLLEAIRAARASGTLNVMHGQVPLASVYDEVLVLFVEKRLRDASRYSGDAIGYLAEMESLSALLAAIGLPEDGDRYVLHAAVRLEGVAFTPPLGAAGSFEFDPSAAEIGGAAVAMMFGGLEGASVAKDRYQAQVRETGAVRRRELQAQGRAVAYGYCPSCRKAVALDLGLACATCHQPAAEPTVAVRADAETVWRGLWSRYPG